MSNRLAARFDVQRFDWRLCQMGEVTFLTKAIKPESSEATLKLGAQLFSFSTRLESIEAPDAVLNGLHAITSPALKLNALGAVRFPVNVSDWAAAS
jgi:hypothetical protein